MISLYANQTATWKYVATINEYNEATYSSVTINCRLEEGNKMVRNAQGQEVVSSATVFTESAIDVNDLINDRLVIAVDTEFSLGGAAKFREVYLI